MKEETVQRYQGLILVFYSLAGVLVPLLSREFTPGACRPELVHLRTSVPESRRWQQQVNTLLFTSVRFPSWGCSAPSRREALSRSQYVRRALSYRKLGGAGFSLVVKVVVLRPTDSEMDESWAVGEGDRVMIHDSCAAEAWPD